VEAGKTCVDRLLVKKEKKNNRRKTEVEGERQGGKRKKIKGENMGGGAVVLFLKRKPGLSAPVSFNVAE